jgi:uncharacterized protein YbcC (UPF0753/DUF2309 family)
VGDAGDRDGRIGRVVNLIDSPHIEQDLVADIGAACERIAPTWPLDQFIAVNPYWGWRTSAINDAAARLGVLAGTTLTMPRSWFHEEWLAGRLGERQLGEAASALGVPELASTARTVLRGGDTWQPPLQRMALVTDLRDQGVGPVPGRTWTDLVTHQISQHCASHFDEWQASWSPDDRVALYRTWRGDPSVTHGFSWRGGRAWARTRLGGLPADPTEAIAAMLLDLGVLAEGRTSYLTALLASINGWAAWCAYRRWQAQLAGADDHAIVELLAIRLAWEWLLAADIEGSDEASALADWAESWTLVDDAATETAQHQQIDWVLQLALERTYQDDVIASLGDALPTTETPEVQAVFCIDVRSEVFRRALESTTTTIHTRGFAGFFGLPIAYSPVGTALRRPQLPGLLAPALDVTDGPLTVDTLRQIADERTTALGDAQRWRAFRRNPSSMFSFVESMGLLYGVKLVKDTLPHHHHDEHWEHEGLDPEHHGLRPRLSLVDDDPLAAAAIGKRVLTAMGLVDGFSQLVLLCGHGSHSANNPHAAGLDCGACGGQTGEVNARALADLLNAPAVRREMAELGVRLPDSTWFVAGLHDTTTDTVTLFDTDTAPETHRACIERLTTQLRQAGHRARGERAHALGLGDLVGAPQVLEQRIVERSTDWSQVRPEWGLAGNAAFVVAPRWRTRHLDLQGRSFLHDYDWRADEDLSVLTLIMTAPMVVTNWINLQYLASTVDNRRYGSGNKVLHNVVGGRIGVFEGNGGDLRIGLSMQSLHDGTTLRHRPLRLSVFIEAPQNLIDEVIDANPVVQHLVHHGWLHLLRIEPSNGSVHRRLGTDWCPAG